MYADIKSSNKCSIAMLENILQNNRITTVVKLTSWHAATYSSQGPTRSSLDQDLSNKFSWYISLHAEFSHRLGVNYRGKKKERNGISQKILCFSECSTHSACVLWLAVNKVYETSEHSFFLAPPLWLTPPVTLAESSQCGAAWMCTDCTVEGTCMCSAVWSVSDKQTTRTNALLHRHAFNHLTANIKRDIKGENSTPACIDERFQIFGGFRGCKSGQLLDPQEHQGWVMTEVFTAVLNVSWDGINTFFIHQRD